MAKKINHLVRHRRWFRTGVETWCGLIVAKAQPFWLGTLCPTCRSTRTNFRASNGEHR